MATHANHPVSRFLPWPAIAGITIASWLTSSALAQSLGDSHGAIELPTLSVQGRAQDLTGIATSASQRRVGQEQFDDRPVLRPGEILEVIPGLIATQHSGGGKANQYFLRGFNLDHGTDFSTSVDGVPINLPTHAHGQGYLDLNILILELVEVVEFKKGNYYAEVGDFSSAGSAQIKLFDKLPKGILKTEIGEFDFYRTVVANSSEVGDGDLLYALEAQYYDGPWRQGENFDKFNGLLKYTGGTDVSGYGLDLRAYRGDWRATDQIAERAVDSGQISRFGNLDSTLDNESERVGANIRWWDTGNNDSRTKANIFADYYRLNLFSNFTYFLDDPVNGDQFEQADRRIIAGGNLSHDWLGNVFGRDTNFTVGTQLRHDHIPQTALFLSQGGEDGERLSTIRDDEVNQSSVGVFANSEILWTDKIRSNLGLRGDIYYFDVDSSIDANSGSDSDTLLSPKLGIVFGPWAKTEYYANAGLGFHSNDGRGATISVDPRSGDPVDTVDPLVRSKGAEIGARTTIIPGLNSTLALWYLELDSELLFVGDAGTTEASRRSRRYGVEFANFYDVNSWLTLDADVAFVDARFTGDDPGGNEIPGLLSRVNSAGASVDFPSGVFGALRLRHFGPRPLIEDDSVRSDSTTLVNLKLGYRYKEDLSFELDIFNLFDSEDSDIDYFYASRLEGEPAEGVEDVHFHPVEPMNLRFGVTYRF